MENYADLLDIAIVNLKEANRSEELRHGLLYVKLQKASCIHVNTLSSLDI